MQGFGFTPAKLKSLTAKRRQKAFSNWLRALYLELLERDSTNPPNEAEFKHLQIEITKAVAWIAEEQGAESKSESETNAESLSFPKEANRELWKEFLSNLYHQSLQKQEKKLHEEDFLPKIIEGDSLIAEAWQPRFDYTIALDQIRSGFNIGSLFRSLDCLGFAGLVSWGISPLPDAKEIKKTAMQAQTWIPHQRVENLALWLAEKKAEGYPILGLETADSACSALDFDWPEKAILVLGNEEYGLSQEVQAQCDHFITLPMYGRKNSMNVVNAFSAAAFLAVKSLEEKRANAR